MTYEDFEKFVREQCMYETIYDDSDGRPILVIRLLDAYGMVNKAAAAEREACAKVCEIGTGEPVQMKTLEILRQERERIAAAIRERGAPALAQPEQEPLWIRNEEGKLELHAPPQREWQTLTENEIKHLWYEACQTNLELTSQLIVHLARNIEAKLKEKNHG